VRKALKELKTGTSNENGSEKAVLQKDSVLQQLKMTNGHAKRNILVQRQDIVSSLVRSKPAAQMENLPEQKKAEDDDTPQRTTKAQALELQAKSIASMSDNFAKSSKSRSLYMEKKLELFELEKARIERQAKRAKLSDLKEAKSLGLITDEQFASEGRRLLNLE